MIYWYTGQPGHGKTLHALQRLLEFKDQGRIVYACNVREFDYAKAGVLEMTPEQFKDWPNFLPDGAVALVDEAYEHGMLPKRAPGSKVPEHVEQLAKHRHRGLDFIFVSQSPDKQCDQFTHDLIERHVHVRRKFGTKIVQLREFDRFEARAEKATPLVSKLHPLPKRPMGLYKSTEMDTTERRIPWYMFAFVIGLPLGVGFFWWTMSGIGGRLGGKHEAQPAAARTPSTQSVAAAGNGASATVPAERLMSVSEYVDQWKPRVPSQPWSAPVYDKKLNLTSEPPRIFCMQAQPGEVVDGYRDNGSCTCLTEQGTRYLLDHVTCAYIARNGQYEPMYDEQRHAFSATSDARAQDYRNRETLRRIAEGEVQGDVGTAPRPGVDPTFGTMTRATF